MTPNDTEMDVLLRRYGKGAGEVKNIGHLDADELNAFAEGALPAAARSRYVSHLADCDQCRRLAGQLAMAAGRVEDVRVPASEPNTEQSWWRKMGVIFSPPAMRYAAFAIVLVAATGIALLVWRQSQPAQRELVAQNQPVVGRTENIEASKSSPNESPATGTTETVNPSQTQQPGSNTSSPGEGTIAKAGSPSTVAPLVAEKKGVATSADEPVPAKPAAPAAEKETALAAKSRSLGDTSSAEASPSYAPPPAAANQRADFPNRDQQNQQNQNQQNVAGLRSGPRKNESFDKYKTIDQTRSGDAPKDREEDRGRNFGQTAATQNKQDDSLARGQTESRIVTQRSRSADEITSDKRRAQKAEEAEPEIRSVGGRKFKRQGNAWVDVKLKSSMAIRTISRGSEEFEKLDSGLRSIARQLGGPILVVWKGKAYRIQ